MKSRLATMLLLVLPVVVSAQEAIPPSSHLRPIMVTMLTVMVLGGLAFLGLLYSAHDRLSHH